MPCCPKKSWFTFQYQVHPVLLRWLDRSLCVALGFSLVAAALMADYSLAYSQLLTPSTEESLQVAASYTAQTTQYTPTAGAFGKGVVATTNKSATPKPVANTPAVKPVKPVAKPLATAVTMPSSRVNHALSKPVPTTPVAKPAALPAPIPTAVRPSEVTASGALVFENVLFPAVEESPTSSSTDVSPVLGKRSSAEASSKAELAVHIPNELIQRAITQHVTSVAIQKGLYSPPSVNVAAKNIATKAKSPAKEGKKTVPQSTTVQDESTPQGDAIAVEFPVLNPTPLTFFDATLNPNDVQLEVSSSLNQYFSHQSLAKVKITTPKGESRTVAIPFKVTVTRPVWVVGGTQIFPNEVLQPSKLTIQRRELTHDMNTAISANQPLTGKAARLVLAPGTPVHTYQLMTPMVVKSHSQVHMVMKGPNGLHMLLEGQALESGRVGDKIRVRNSINPDKIYTGEVIGDNRVSVKLGQ